MKTITTEKTTLRYPCLITRTIASFVDLLIAGIAGLALWELNRLLAIPPVVNYVSVVFIIMYQPVCTSLGATLGQYLMNIRIRQVNNMHKTINMLRSVFRFFLKLVLSLASMVPLQTREDNRSLHDIASGSIVINV
ncbi:RDD family protein [Roseivirga sp. BDSF3-8]|uniref:RDD family protein n=1 Tax=Roseivirga sp. BDSF3-8 TaxID=3241598 RepID=UPI003531F969